MQAFHGKQAIKETFLSRVRAHRRADEIVKGQYWEDGKGCAVGCTIHGSDHSKYETELGIPYWLAKVEDTIFEGLPNERAKEWPEQFLEAITPGADLDKIKPPFMIYILEGCVQSIDSANYDADKFPQVKEALEQSKAAVLEMIRCWREGVEDKGAAWSAACAARSAAWSAESAAWSAESAACAARSAAWSAESAACAARSAEWAAWSAEWAARSASYERYADKLLVLLKECK